jgi:hypothetical protein
MRPGDRSDLGRAGKYEKDLKLPSALRLPTAAKLETLDKMPGSQHTGAVRHSISTGEDRPGSLSREDILEERSLVLHCCGGVGSTWMGRHRVAVGSPGSVGFNLVFSGRDSRSVPDIGCLGLFRSCSSMALGSGSVGSANPVDARIPGNRKSLSPWVDHGRRAGSPSHALSSLRCIP